MAIAYESNTDLAFDTSVLRNAGTQYKKVASELKTLASDLDSLLASLEKSGWTTPAGSAFHETTNTNWEKNIEKYAALLETLNTILCKAATEYDDLMTDYVRRTKVKL